MDVKSLKRETVTTGQIRLRQGSRLRGSYGGASRRANAADNDGYRRMATLNKIFDADE